MYYQVLIPFREEDEGPFGYFSFEYVEISSQDRICIEKKQKQNTEVKRSHTQALSRALLTCSLVHLFTTILTYTHTDTHMLVA